jgi:hypothetical protein
MGLGGKTHGLRIEGGAMKRLAPILSLLADLGMLAALVGIAALFWTTFHGRVGYPFDLEWMEGGMLLHAERVRDGLPVYALPSPEYIPYIYPPLYAWVVGVLGRIFGVSYALGRWVTFLGTSTAALLLVVGLRREGVRWGLGFAGAALFLTCYDDGGAFFDLVRTDGLLVALLAGALLACRSATPWGLRIGGLLLTAAFATKHNAAIMGIPVAAALWWEYGWKRAARFAAWSVIPALIFVVVLQITTHGLFLTYIVGVPATHPLVAERLFPKAEKELFVGFPWFNGAALGAAVLLLLLGLRTPRAARAGRLSFSARYWLLNLVFGSVMCILMRGHHGGFVNVLIPGWWLVAFCSSLALGRLVERFPRVPIALLTAALVVWQTWAGRWDPKRYVPDAEDLEAGQKVLEVIASYPGDVLMPQSPYYPVMVGKKPSFALIGLWDITHEHSPFAREARSVNRAIAHQRYSAIILSSPKFPYGLDRTYKKTRTINLPGRAFFTKTGWRARPRYVYERKTPEEMSGRGKAGAAATTGPTLEDDETPSEAPGEGGAPGEDGTEE